MLWLPDMLKVHDLSGCDFEQAVQTPSSGMVQLSGTESVSRGIVWDPTIQLAASSRKSCCTFGFVFNAINLRRLSKIQ
jgi:hypothetical protein